MPRFFFSCEGAQTFTDQQGTELSDLRSAWIQAIENAGQVLKDHAACFVNDAEWRMKVTNEQGDVLFTLHFSAEEGTAGAPK